MNIYIIKNLKTGEYFSSKKPRRDDTIITWSPKLDNAKLYKSFHACIRLNEYLNKLGYETRVDIYVLIEKKRLTSVNEDITLFNLK